MKKIFLSAVAILALGLALFQCKPDNGDPLSGLNPTLPAQTFNYSTMASPDGRTTSSGHFETQNGIGTAIGNPFVSDAGATLGRVLFYDKRLSLNNTVACGSCHHQETAFSDGGQKGSVGMNGEVTSRNSSSITNAAFKNFLFWDSRVTNLTDMVGGPVTNHIEMGMESLDQLAKKLEQVSFYPPLFEKAFGSKSVKADRIRSALAQFVSAMVSSNSKYDEGAKIGFSNFTADELAGKALFFNDKNRCNICHAAPLFGAPDSPQVGYYGNDTRRGSANIGLDMSYKDNGVIDGQFCIPSLRNATLTAPYMHDGRFSTLEECIEHYNSKMVNHPSLDFNLRDNFTGAPKKLGLTETEKMQLIAFIGTLTDRSLTTDPKFSNPFPQ